jgi:hypothetical protein
MSEKKPSFTAGTYQPGLYWFSGKRSIAAFAKLVPSDLLSPFDGFFLKRCG